MKPVLLLLLFVFGGLRLYGQKVSFTKPSTIELHVFYTDFQTVQQIRKSSVGTVLNKRRWSEVSDMQMGAGFSYIKGLTRNVDAVVTIDGSYIDYVYQDSTTAGSSRFLLDMGAALNVKMLSDRYVVVPYLSGGIGASFYKGTSGFYMPVGAGLQFNVFGEASVFLNMQYRLAISRDVNHHFRYGIGIATAIGKRKVMPEKPVELPPVIPPESLPAKTITVTVTDEATGQPLPYVDVVVNGPEGKRLAGSTDARGQVVFNELAAADYTVTGMLNGINTTAQSIAKSSFGAAGQEMEISISHNDPRFTLDGHAMNKTTGNPEGGVVVTISNETKSSIATKQSHPGDGSFHTQLEAESDFTIVGKKASYISNIERVSTKGLNRSATLYVKLELLVEEASMGKAILLSNIYYGKGSASISSSASSDLEKLAQFLKDNPDIRIEIASYTDSRGSDATNMKLSNARANAVRDYLLEIGIASSRMVPIGYGESKLINGCINGVSCTEAQHQENRRTEFKLVE